MFVNEHKTFAEYGPMPIRFDAAFCLEVNRCTIRATNILNTYIFPRSAGQRMTSIDVCRGLQEISGIAELTLTRMRKLRATKLHDTYLPKRTLHLAASPTPPFLSPHSQAPPPLPLSPITPRLELPLQYDHTRPHRAPLLTSFSIIIFNQSPRAAPVVLCIRA